MTAVVVLAAMLRFVGESSRGLIYWDEAKFALEGIRFNEYLAAITGSNGVLYAGKSIGTAKPTHAILIAFTYGLFGIHTYAPLFMDAFASLIEVVLVWFVGRRLYGPWAGVIAALFLAVSKYDVIYARSALSESDANAIFLGAVALWVIDWERMRAASESLKGFPSRGLVYAAVLAGVAFTTNYRALVYIFVLVAFDLVWTVNEYGFKPLRGRVVSWIGGLAAAPVLWQLVDVAARLDHHVLFRSEVNVIVHSGHKVIFKSVQEGKPEWYLQQALFQLHGGKQSALKFNPLVYVQWFVAREGLVIAALLAVAFILTTRSPFFPWLGMSVLVLGPFLIYSFAPFIVPRNLDTTLPFACILASAALVSLAERVPHDVGRRVVVIVLAVAIGGLGVDLAWPITRIDSGFAKASNYIQSHGNGKAVVSNEIMAFYLSGKGGTGCNAVPPPSSLRRLAADRNAGYRYAVLDHRVRGETAYIFGHARKVRRFLVLGTKSVGENLVASENGDPPTRKSVPHVWVYDLQNLHLPPAGNVRPAVCRRNVPL